MAGLSVEGRKANVGKISGMVLVNRDAIREAMYKDFGSHPNATTALAEILGFAGFGGSGNSGCSRAGRVIRI
jgi:hypothetical protein